MSIVDKSSKHATFNLDDHLEKLKSYLTKDRVDSLLHRNTNFLAEIRYTHCGIDMVMYNEKYICNMCGLMLMDKSDERFPLGSNVIRIVGLNSGVLQPRLYNGSVLTPQMKEMAVKDELIKLRSSSKFGDRIPYEVCTEAAALYSKIQVETNKVSRNQNKRTQIAELIRSVGTAKGVSIDVKDISDMMQINKQGTAKGRNKLGSFLADGLIDITFASASETLDADINTVIEKLDLGIETNYELITKIKNCAKDLVELSIAKKIGMHSTVKTKSSGAVYVVLIRCGITKYPTIVEYCIGERKLNTIKKYVETLNDYHSKFVDIYKKYDINYEKLTL